MEHTLRYLHGDTALQILTNLQRLSCFCPVFFNTTTVVFTELQPTTVEVLVAQMRQTFCSPAGSSVHGILQARIPEWGSHFLLQSNRCRGVLFAINLTRFTSHTCTYTPTHAPSVYMAGTCKGSILKIMKLMVHIQGQALIWVTDAQDNRAMQLVACGPHCAHG